MNQESANPSNDEDVPVILAAPRDGSTQAQGGLNGQVQTRLSARRIVAVFFATVLFFLAVLSIAPVFVEWNEIRQSLAPRLMPRWSLLLLFVAFLQAVYAFLLARIPDWSALRVTSWLLVGYSCLYAMTAAALATGGSGSRIVVFLQLADSLRARGVIWLLALTCINGLIGYLMYREYYFWRRTEELWHELFGKQEPSGGRM